MLKIKLLSGSFIVISLLGCTKDSISKNEPEIKATLLANEEYVQFGTSFNNCIGYCYHNVLITAESVFFEKRGLGLSDTVPYYYAMVADTPDKWNRLKELTDMTSFMRIDSIIGCPDCADDGAEWIEIKSGNKIHRITYDYGKVPASQKDLEIYLISFLNSFESH